MKRKDYRVLVLNADFQPLNLVPISTDTWENAFCLIFKDKATPISYYDDAVKTVDKEYPIPSVIILKEYKKLKIHARWSKTNVKIREGFHCAYCRKRFSHRSLTVDHVRPSSKGGKTTWENTVAACKPCNHRKSDGILNMVPAITPYRPTYYELATKMLKLKQSVIHKDWAPYINLKT